ncbi:EAL domain-containing protein [Mycolicibacterium sp. 018/SC-01/001]|uniref:sensor domain-containing phosphodiesterase n=1 Tax=Mycolicibacterium sp. 018/SC-01/001 TaxID=2592069 RepID=UPI00117CDAB1|nr:EAL domain-containing protein [Mycolicibacterium sp. 018/SC-01/001]TRW80317.1 EAL domain-containing protein [Mycolicibacterium sp. 018/SC-01/001]
MQNLVAAINASIDPAALVQRIAEQMCLLTPKADGAAVSLLTADTFVVVSAHGLVESVLGLTVPRYGSLQGRAIDTGRPQISRDPQTDPDLAESLRTIGKHLDINSLVVIPLMHRGTGIGALSLSATDGAKFTERDVAAMEATARFVSALIGAHTELSSMLDEFLGDPNHEGSDLAAQFLASVLLPDMAREDALHQRVSDMLAAPSPLSAVYQPIVELGSEAVVGFEGLCRFPVEAERSPAYWFDVARRLGRGIPLELAALDRVLAGVDDIPAGRFVAVNASPSTAMDPRLHDALLAVPRPVVLEITEHEPFPDGLADALKPLRDNGIRLAIDDAGAGYASFTQMLQLRPDIIKIDGSLTSGIDLDPAKRALVTAIVRLCDEMGATTIAEAIERVDEQATLAELGVELGQGYLFGRPSVLASRAS